MLKLENEEINVNKLVSRIGINKYKKFDQALRAAFKQSNYL